MQKKSKNAKKNRNAKKAEMQIREAENARSISKFMQKKGRNAKKKQKMPFNLKIHARKGQKWKKRKHIYLDFFRF